jgi:FlaA1/EpsC-like NDP-sugar epimerase
VITQLLHRSPARSARGRAASRRCLVVGAGSAGRAIARDLRRNPEFGLTPVGFLDDRVPRRRRVNGLPVLGSTTDLAELSVRLAIDTIVVAIPSLPAREIRRLTRIAAAENLNVRYLPSFGDALEREARLSDLQHVRLDRLLGRGEQRVVRAASRAVLAGKRVLVTGAGGSIGSELCRQIKGLGPVALSLLDHDESNLHRLKMELDGEALLDTDDVIIADIRDQTRIEQVFRERRPEVVFHAAAHKHLPLLERHPCEGVKANVLGTKNLVDAALAVGVDRFILISTDKAADPTSVLGATKRVAEMILAARATEPTRFASVRFGNVLGSRGSFVSVLADQIENGEPVTVTHPDVTRFFMTVEEAVGLVIEAAAMAEFGDVFVLDMGEPVRIVDLVRNYIRQLHLDVDDVEVRYTGLRPGEKLDEALFSTGEECLPTAHPRIWSARTRSAAVDLDGLDSLVSAATHNDMAEVRGCLAELVAGYHPCPSAQLEGCLATYYPDGF